MTKIEVIVPFAIYENGSHRACSEGDVTEIDDAEARRMAAAGFVKILGASRRVESAEAPEVETAEALKPRRKKE